MTGLQMFGTQSGGNDQMKVQAFVIGSAGLARGSAWWEEQQRLQLRPIIDGYFIVR